MNKIQNLINRFFGKVEPLPAGTHHFQAPPDAEKPYRLHLRLEQDGTGILLLNASTVLHLNQTAAEYAYHLVNQTPTDEVVKTIRKRYNISADAARNDLSDLSERLNILINTEDLDPVTYLGFDREDPYSRHISAPLRLDCALTYQTSRGQDSDTPMDRVKRELQTEEWLAVIGKASAAGIPHIIFTGGEPTLRPDLVDLIAGAEKNDQVTGLITDGLRIAERDYLQRLLMAGLDHMMIILEPENETAWEAIRDTLPEDIALSVHLTMTPKTEGDFATLVSRLATMGVQAVSISTSDASLNHRIEAVQQLIADRGMRLVWNLPVPYSHQHPVAIELAETGETTEGAGTAWLYIEPDGDVLPGQGINRVLGNLLNDSWEQIWSAARRE